MSDLDALLAGIVADPQNAVRWLVMADYLEENGQPERAELVRVHRELLRTCTDPDAFPERPQLHARMMELMRTGVRPCIPERTLVLPGWVELRMSFIPSGSFLMGSPEMEEGREDDETLHHVTLTKGFWLSQTPVTQGQWAAMMGTSPSEFKGEGLPVESISWDEARAFCAAVAERVGFEIRLPTEAEWEYAARAGTTTPFYWGGELDKKQASYNGHQHYETEVRGPFEQQTTEVGSFTRASPHPWELADMLGNVWEWCSDIYSSYPTGEATDPLGPKSGSERVDRGGSWNQAARHCRSARRGTIRPGYRGRNFGFRIAASLL